MKFAGWFIALALSITFAPTAVADINFSDGEGDLTFYYQSQTDTWFTVFRAKGNTVATGLDDPFTGFTGIVGLGNDFNFAGALNVLVDTDTSLAVNGTNYFVSAADGSPFIDEGTSDLGIRMRLRENEVALNIGANTDADQFDSFNLTLDRANSTFNGLALDQPGSPDLVLLAWVFNTPIPLIETADNQLTANFSNWEHVHRHWGFSELGDYSLAFELEGVGGTYGSTASIGNAVVNFSVVPEPMTIGLLAAGACCLLLGRRARKR